MSSMKIDCAFDELVPLEKLVPHPRNTNRHSIEQINALAKLINAHGFRYPIVVSKRSGFIVSGHGRLDALKALKEETAPVDYQDFASEAEEFQVLTSDNEIARWAELDYQEVYKALNEIEGIDSELLGISDFNPKAIEVDLPDLDANEPDCQQVTFTLSNEQKDILDEALEKSKREEDQTDEINKNSNGNALSAILKRYVYG